MTKIDTNYVGFYLEPKDKEILDIVAKLKNKNLSELMRSIVKDAINNIKEGK